MVRPSKNPPNDGAWETWYAEHLRTHWHGPRPGVSSHLPRTGPYEPSPYPGASPHLLRTGPYEPGPRPGLSSHLPRTVPFEPGRRHHGPSTLPHRHAFPTETPPLFDDTPPPASRHTPGRSRPGHGAMMAALRMENLAIRDGPFHPSAQTAAIGSSRVHGSRAVEPREARHERGSHVVPSRAEGSRHSRARYEAEDDRDPGVGASRGGRSRPIINDRTSYDEAVARRLAHALEEAHQQEERGHRYHDGNDGFRRRLARELGEEHWQVERGYGRHEDHDGHRRRMHDERAGAPREHGDTKGKGKARSEPEPEPKAKPGTKPKTGHIRRCRVCFEDFDKSELLSPCDISHSHYYCKDCLERGMRSQKAPFICCDNQTSINIDKVAEDLDPMAVKEYKNIVLEHNSKDKFYCANKTCSAFITADKIQNNEGICDKCGKTTCHSCKALSHPGKPCKKDREAEKVKQLGKQRGWKQCPDCRQMIARSEGCWHMKCTTCGADWCFRCGKKNCDTQICLRPSQRFQMEDLFDL